MAWWGGTISGGGTTSYEKSPIGGWFAWGAWGTGALVVGIAAAPTAAEAVARE